MDPLAAGLDGEGQTNSVGQTQVARTRYFRMLRANVGCMGQPVGVVASTSSNGLLRFTANRNLTGMGHERFATRDAAVGPRPAAALARRLFDTGKVDAVHIFGNIVTVTVTDGRSANGLSSIVEGLYTYYVAGFVPPPIEMPEEPAAAAGAPAGGDGGGGATGLDPRVPAHLWDRSRKGKETWLAKQAG